jgi:uncharacterized membrane protein YgaE (UPF0421/DUF939 family)
MGLIALIAYWVSFIALEHVWGGSENQIGALWAVVSAIVVYRQGSPRQSILVALSRASATIVSFVCCLLWLLLLPPTPFAMAIVIVVQTLVLLVLGRNDDVATAAVTTAVVMIVAMIDPRDAWHQPILRFLDTAIGIAIGMIFRPVARTEPP